jgi:replication factor C small subunit
MPQFFDVDENDPQRETSIWVEKYRPKKLEDYIGNEKIKKKANVWIENNDLPMMLLLQGPPGTGKTALAQILTSSIDCDDMYINASDENSVDTVRNRVKSYASSVAMNNLKVIVLDEFDYMTRNGQAALRNLSETYSDTTRFILSCNYKEKIISAIDSRSQTLTVKPPKKSKVASHMAWILNNENVKFEPEQVKKLVDQYYPDIRKVINTAQLNSRDGNLDLDEATLAEANFQRKLVKKLSKSGNIDKKFTEIRKLIQNSDVSRYERVFRYLYDHVDDYASGNVAEAIIEISEAQHRDAQAVDKEINFMHLIIELIQITS